MEYYLKLIDYLLPTDESIKASCLWHSDFHDENIYVNPDNHAEIVGIIDWQNTDILPLFDHARQPPILDYDGPEVKGLERPELDKDVNKRTPDERRRALALFHDQTLVALYRMLIHGTNKVLWRAMEFLETPASDMLRFAQVLLVDGEAVYLARLTDFESDWADLPKVRAQGNPPFPLQFTLKEVMAIEHDLVASQHGMRLMDSVKANVGDLFPEKGIVVNHDQYEDSKNALRQVKLELYEQLGLDDEEKAEWDSSWPFDDVPTLVHGLIDQQGDLKP